MLGGKQLAIQQFVIAFYIRYAVGYVCFFFSVYDAFQTLTINNTTTALYEKTKAFFFYFFRELVFKHREKKKRERAHNHIEEYEKIKMRNLTNRTHL